MLAWAQRPDGGEDAWAGAVVHHVGPAPRNMPAFKIDTAAGLGAVGGVDTYGADDQSREAAKLSAERSARRWHLRQLLRYDRPPVEARLLEWYDRRVDDFRDGGDVRIGLMMSEAADAFPEMDAGERELALNEFLEELAPPPGTKG